MNVTKEMGARAILDMPRADRREQARYLQCRYNPEGDTPSNWVCSVDCGSSIEKGGKCPGVSHTYVSRNEITEEEALAAINAAWEEADGKYANLPGFKKRVLKHIHSLLGYILAKEKGDAAVMLHRAKDIRVLSPADGSQHVVDEYTAIETAWGLLDPNGASDFKVLTDPGKVAAFVLSKYSVDDDTDED